MNMTNNLNDLRKIKISSSFEFCRQALLYLQNHIQSSRISDPDKFLEDLNKQGKTIVKMQPNMASLKKKIAMVIYIFKRAAKTKKNSEEIKRSAVERIQDLIDLANQKQEKIAAIGSKLITSNAKIVTIGNSTLVSEIFIAASLQKRKFEVYCLESSPTGEGKVLAESLVRKGITTYLTGDAAMASVLQQVTFALVGATRIYEDAFVNKMGTLPLAMIARSLQLPFYLACETDKILRESEYAVRFYQNDPDEIYIPKNKKLDILNLYYESISSDYITKFITEDGVFDTVEFKDWYLKD